MSNWIDKYKKLVISSHKKHLIIADQDILFEYNELQQAFLSEGYTLLNCKTALSVRLDFELKVRDYFNFTSIWYYIYKRLDLNRQLLNQMLL
jgi:hypothetical protein